LVPTILSGYSEIEGSILKAKEAYDKATSLMKRDHRKHAKQTIQWLKEAQSQLLKSEPLSHDQEAWLSKINSHIYWQSKFSSFEHDHIADPIQEAHHRPKKTKHTATTNTKDFETKLETKLETNFSERNDPPIKEPASHFMKSYQKLYEKTTQYEAKHEQDNMSHLLNYMELHAKAYDSASSAKALEKTQYYAKKVKQQKRDIISKHIPPHPSMKRWENEKSYDKIYHYILSTLQNPSLNAEQKGIIKQHAIEINALANIKNRLLLTGSSKAFQFPRNPQSIQGVVVDIDNNGMVVKADHFHRSRMSWSVLSDTTILALGMNVIDRHDPKDMLVAALAHLKTEMYVEAYAIFKNLADLDPVNYLKYRNYLSLCETGFRISQGPSIEKMFNDVQAWCSAGYFDKAIELMIQWRSHELDHDLGRAYHKRIQYYHENITKPKGNTFAMFEDLVE
jgi:hypothetical protein